MHETFLKSLLRFFRGKFAHVHSNMSCLGLLFFTTSYENKQSTNAAKPDINWINVEPIRVNLLRDGKSRMSICKVIGRGVSGQRLAS